MFKNFLHKAFAINLSTVPMWQRLFFLSSLAVLVTSAIVSFTDLFLYDGIDFLQRYVEAKFGLLGIEPYKTSADWWWNGIAPAFHEAHFKGTPRLSGVGCNSPCLLLFYMPLTFLDFEAARYVSGCLEWGAFLFVICLLARVTTHNHDRVLAVSLAFFFFAGAPFWRLHVERGQYYVFTILLIALSLFLLLKKNKRFLSGLLLGVAISIRPTLLFILLPFLFQRRWKIFPGVICGGMVMGILSMAVFGVEGWKNFVWISHKYEMASTDFTTNHFSDCLKSAAPLPTQPFEQSTKLGAAPLPSVNSTVVGLVRVTKPVLDRFAIPVTTVLFFSKLAGVGIACLFVLIFTSRFMCVRPHVPLPDRYLVYVGIVAVNLVEYVIPYRAAYADIYYLLPVMLGIPIVALQKETWLGVLLLISLASQQNLLGLVNGWYAIPVRVVGLTLFSVGVLCCWHAHCHLISADGGTDEIK